MDPSEQNQSQRWLQRFLEEHQAVAGTVHRLDRQTQDLHLEAAVNIPPKVQDATRVIPRGKGMAGLALERHRPVSTCNLATDEGNPDVRPGARAVEAAAAIALPVDDDAGQVRAVVGIAYASERPIDDALLAPLQAAVTTLP
ncbi:MAG: GAF domain-containing protein [Myxococcota bacterium]